VIIFQVPQLRGDAVRDVVATVFPAVTGAILAIQLKQNWYSKAYKAKKSKNTIK